MVGDPYLACPEAAVGSRAAVARSPENTQGTIFEVGKAVGTHKATAVSKPRKAVEHTGQRRRLRREGSGSTTGQRRRCLYLRGEWGEPQPGSGGFGEGAVPDLQIGPGWISAMLLDLISPPGTTAATCTVPLNSSHVPFP